MKILLKELAQQAKEIKTEIEALEPQVKGAEQEVINAEDDYQQVDNKIRDIEEQEYKKGKQIMSWSERKRLESEKSRLYEVRTECRQKLDQVDRKLQDKISELQKVESSLFADKRARQHKKEMTELKQGRDEKAQALDELRTREEAETVLLDTLKQQREEKMKQAILAEVEQGKNAPETEKLHKKLNEEIALQESRLEVLSSVIERTEKAYSTACNAFKEARDNYHYSAYKLAELEYMAALRGLMPTAAKFKAAQSMAGIHNYKDFSFSVEDDLVNEQAARLQKELETV